jgi:hypothetical protein
MRQRILFAKKFNTLRCGMVRATRPLRACEAARRRNEGVIPMESDNLTFHYGDDEGRMASAKNIYEHLMIYIDSDPARARTQAIAQIQSALGQAFAQGFARDGTKEQDDGE